MNFSKVIDDVGFKLISLAVTDLPKDVRDKITKAYEEEQSPIGKTQLKTIIEDIQLADDMKLPMCQDTGIISFYVKVGCKFPGISTIEESLTSALRRATTEIP